MGDVLDPFQVLGGNDGDGHRDPLEDLIGVVLAQPFDDIVAALLGEFDRKLELRLHLVVALPVVVGHDRSLDLDTGGQAGAGQSFGQAAGVNIVGGGGPPIINCFITEAWYRGSVLKAHEKSFEGLGRAGRERGVRFCLRSGKSWLIFFRFSPVRYQQED